MDRLEEVIRRGESPENLVLLLRGGEDTAEKLLRQAANLEARFTYGGQLARGISLFAARDEKDELRVLEAKLRTYAKFRRVSGPRLLELAVLLPTFAAPHWTVLLRAAGSSSRSEQQIITAFIDILGPVMDNPKYTPDRKRR